MENDNEIKNKRGNPFWVKGVSGNPKGRPKGPTLKEWARERLMHMNEDERDDFLNGLPKEIVWQMAEGRPEQKAEVKVDNKDSYTEEELLAAQEYIAKRLNTNRETPKDSSGEATTK